MFRSASEGNQRTKAKNVPAKIMMPPMVGITCLWSFLSSVGSSNSLFRMATLIREGVENKTTPKAVKNVSKSSSIQQFLNKFTRKRQKGFRKLNKSLKTH